MGIGRKDKLSTVEPGFTIDSETSPRRGRLRKGGSKQSIISEGRWTRGIGLSEEKNVRGVGGNKIDTVRMLGAKLGREPLILKRAKERESLKVVGKGGTSRKKTLNKRITAKKFKTGIGSQRRGRWRIKKDLGRNKVAKTSKGRRSRDRE